MANFQDWSVGSGKETTYGTAVTVNRWYEFTEPKPFTPDRGIKQGVGIRPGARVARSARRVQTLRQASGDITVEMCSKGLGLLLEACMGTGTSTNVSGSTYQQNHNLGDSLTSHTIQFGVPNMDGTIRPITFAGCVVSAWEIGGAVGDIATLKTTWDARSWTTGTAYATPSYPTATANNLFSVEDATLYTGTYTAATTTALASALTPVGGVKDFKLSVDNAIIMDRFFAGASGLKDKPLPGTRLPTVEMNVEYRDNTLWDAFDADTPMVLVVTLSNGVALSTGTETIQIALPCLKLDGDLPEGGPDAIASQPIKLSVLDDLTNPAVVISTRTSDSAL